MNEKRGGFHSSFSIKDVSLGVNSHYIAGGDLRPVKSLGVDQILILRARRRQAEVIAHAFAQSQPVGPAQRGGQVDLGLLQGLFPAGRMRQAESLKPPTC